MSNCNLKYFILTKFNQYFNYSVDNEYVNINNSVEWLENRFHLFDKYCFPSIVNQTNRNFLWLVFFAHDTPEFYKDLIFKYNKIFENFVPIFTVHGAFKLEPYLEVIRNYLEESDQYLITTRLDSDDCLNKDFVDNIFRSFRVEDDYFLDCPNGIQYDIVNKVLVKVNIKSNSFLTRVEKIDDAQFRTVLELKSHISAGDLYKLIEIKIPFMWLQVLHDDNILNKLIIKSNPFILPSICKGEFYIKEYPNYSFGTNLINYFKVFFNRFKFQFKRL